MMKKLVRLAIFLTLILTTTMFTAACGTHTPPSRILHAEATVTAGELTYRADIESDGQSLTITLLSPAPTAETVYRYENERLTVEYQGLRCIAGDNYLPDGSFQQRLYRALSAMDQAVYTGSSDGEDRYTANDAVICCKKGAVTSITSGDVAFEFDE